MELYILRDVKLKVPIKAYVNRHKVEGKRRRVLRVELIPAWVNQDTDLMVWVVDTYEIANEARQSFLDYHNSSWNRPYSEMKPERLEVVKIGIIA